MPQASRLAAVFAESVAAIGRHGRVIGGWILPFALVLVLAFENGGYDVGIRSEIGIAVWWIVLVGAASGMLQFSRIGTAGVAVVAIAAAFALWTGLGITWSESAERSAIELARVATYVGILVLALALQGREGLRRTISAVGAAIAVVCVAALISRLQPGTFGEGIDTVVLGSGESRLNYPLNYWNGLAALMAVGIPLLLTMALRARSLVAQALAAAAVPMLAVTAFYTFSRGGAVEIGVALVVLVVFYPRRLAALPTLALCAAGSAILIAAAAQRDALENGIAAPALRREGDEMLAVVLVVCAGVALVQVAIGLIRRYDLGPRLDVPRKVTWACGIVTAVLALVVALGPAELGERWEEFKQPDAPAGVGAARFESTSGSGRYQTWNAAIDANASEPLTGIGPGSYEFWWAREAEIAGFVRDAHSLYLEALGELGIVGFGLVVGLVGGTLVVGARRVPRASEDKAALLAGGIAAGSAFAVAATIDWAWELAVLPCAFMLLAAAIVGPKVVRRPVVPRRSRTTRGRRDPRRSQSDSPIVRVATVAGAAAGLVAIAIPFAATDAISESTAAAREGNLGSALERADRAAAIQPYAASPRLQRAFLLAQRGKLGAAALAAREATDEEATNWRTWLALSAIEARRGKAAAAVDAYREARSLNPRSIIFTQVEPQ